MFKFSIADTTDTVETERPDDSGCHLPPIVAPQLAAFTRLVDAGGCTFDVGDADPFITQPCPPWCYTGRDSEDDAPEHIIETSNAERQHNSRPIVIPMQTLWGQRFDRRVYLGHVEVSLEAPATRKAHVTPWVLMTKETLRKGTDELCIAEVFRATPDEARALARALLAAADLADPDGEFDTAAPAPLDPA